MSAARLPRWLGDERRPWFCFENRDAAARALGPPSEGVQATIVIERFTIHRGGSDEVNSASFVRLVRGGPTSASLAARCYRSAHSMLFGPPTRSGQQGKGPGWLRLEGVSRNNLKQVDCAIPLGVMTAVTGISGSGSGSGATTDRPRAWRWPSSGCPSGGCRSGRRSSYLTAPGHAAGSFDEGRWGLAGGRRVRAVGSDQRARRSDAGDRGRRELARSRHPGSPRRVIVFGYLGDREGHGRTVPPGRDTFLVTFSADLIGEIDHSSIKARFWPAWNRFRTDHCFCAARSKNASRARGRFSPSPAISSATVCSSWADPAATDRVSDQTSS